MYANAAVEGLLGWTPDDLVGAPLTTLVPRRLQASHRAAFARWVEGAGDLLDGRYLRLAAQAAGGHEVPVGMVLSPVEAPDGSDVVLGLIRPRDARHEAVNAVALELVSVLSQERSVAGAVNALLRAIGDRLAWDAANLWVVDDDAGELRPLAQWSAAPEVHGAFLAETAASTFSAGEGLPGRVWSTGLSSTIERLDDDPGFARLPAARSSGLLTGFAFPVEHEERIVGVIEMFRARPEPIESEHVSVLSDIGTQLGPFLHRMRTRDRDRRAEERLRLLTEGTQRLARRLDHPSALDDVCDLLVPAVADTCVVDLVRDGRLERVGQAFDDDEHEAAVERLSGLVPLETIHAGPIAVVEEGRTVVHQDIGPETMAAGLPSTVPREVIDVLAPISTVIVPLIGRGEVVGALTLGRRNGRFDDDERRFAEELGRHVGLAVANTALFERERAVAEALQKSLLPPRLPEVPDLEVASRYEPGATRLVVGGDFYDLFAVDDTCWYAVVGDVCGTGAEAAAITSQVRYSVRALAPRVDGPAELLDDVNAALLDRGDTRFCTALVARLSPDDDGFEVTLASGGHPPAVLISRDGTRLVDCPGTLLGIYAEATHEEVTLTLRRGEALALYTDGVTEARDADGVMLGDERLVELLDACVDEHAEKTAEQLVQAAVEHAAYGPTDDIAVLVLRHG